MSISRIVLTLLLFFSINISYAQTFVNVNVSGGSNNGSSWANAYSELSAAINNAGTNETIWVAQGTYKPTNGTTRSVTFNLPQGIELYGGFSGWETMLSQRDWENNTTILSGDIGSTSDDSDNSYHVIAIEKTITSVTIDGFTISDGYADGQYNEDGGAIFINAYATASGTAPSISNCTFSNNFANLSGGAIYINAGNNGSAFASFDNCIFQDNESGSSGGAAYTNGSVGGNTITSYHNCKFVNNFAGESAGAVFSHGGNGGNANPVFKQCNFESNTADLGNGGALYNLGTISNGNSNPTIINCRFFDNSGYAAGAIYNNGSNGGHSNPKITNCTFVRNYTTGAGGTGGAIYCNGSISGESAPLISNCILWGNISPDAPVIRSVDGSPTVQYSIVDVTDCVELQSGVNPNITCGSGVFFNMDPLFTYEAGGDLTLTSTSPALDVGDNNMNTEPFDLANSTRIINTIIDIGAYEKTAAPLPVELVNFKAQLHADRVKLSWITANEINNDFFTIQHSVDGIHFENVERVEGAGTTSFAQSYVTSHENPDRGINYYRLQQTDYDGKTSFSHIESVKVFDGKLGTYPNPVLDKLNISFSDFEVGKVDFAIFNIYGKEIFRDQVDIQDGLHVIALNEVGSFLPGTYVIKVFHSQSEIFVQKFTKVRD